MFEYPGSIFCLALRGSEAVALRAAIPSHPGCSEPKHQPLGKRSSPATRARWHGDEPTDGLRQEIIEGA